MGDRADRLHEAEATMRMLQHEVRTPLGHIIGYSEMLEEEVEERDQQDLCSDLQKIRSAATRLLDLVDGKLLTDPTEEIAQARPSGAENVEAASVGPVGEPAAVSRGNVLIVDADVDARERLARRLQDGDFAVETAKDGIDALRRIADGNCELVILDAMLPGMSGLEVLERIRRSRSMSELPVLVTAASTDSSDAIEGLHRGGNEFIAKPFETSVMVARIEAHLTAHRSAKQVAALARQLEFRAAFIRQALGRKVPEDLLVELSERPDATTLGGESGNVIAVVADIRGTRRWIAECAPDQVFAVLNNVFGPLGSIVERYGGSVETIDGDSLTALFGLPAQADDDAERAAACGVAMQLAMRDVNARNRRGGLPEIAIGVGIASGEVLIGGIGSGEALRFAVIGSPMIRAALIESTARPGEVLACQETCERVGSLLELAVRPESPPSPGADERVSSILGVGGGQLISLRADSAT